MSYNLLKATAFALFSCGSNFGYAQEITATPRLVISITIDKLGSDDISIDYSNLSENGLKLFLNKGLCYNNIEYKFSPADNSAVIASISTGTTPYNNGIIANLWFDRNSTKIKSCVEDFNYQGVLTDENCSAENILTTTLSDELKYNTQKKGLVYSISPNKEFAILTAGHNADGAYWINGKEGNWCTTTYYEKKIPNWVEKVNALKKKNTNKNNRTTDLAIECIKSNFLGKDNITDLLYIEYEPDYRNKDNDEERNQFLRQTDSNIKRLLSAIKENTSLDDVLFIITGTGHYSENENTSKLERYPGGKFYINRAADLLNMYLGAIYGTDKYVLGFCNNQIYLNTLLIDKKKIKTSEIAYYAKKFLRQCQGINNVLYCDDILIGESYNKNAYNIKNSGDIIVETSPGWKIVNENNDNIFNTSFSTFQTSIIIYNSKINKKNICQPTEISNIIEHISKILKIRAPNGCKRF